MVGGDPRKGGVCSQHGLRVHTNQCTPKMRAGLARVCTPFWWIPAHERTDACY